MLAKRLFMVLLMIGVVTAAGVIVARVTIGPSYAGPSSCTGAH
jgi:hypothetical protein